MARIWVAETYTTDAAMPSGSPNAISTTCMTPRDNNGFRGGGAHCVVSKFVPVIVTISPGAAVSGETDAIVGLVAARVAR